jgi:hypothetical protein
MQALVLVMFVVATTFDYLAKGDRFGRFAVLPGAAAYVAELLSVAAVVYVVVAGARIGFRFVRPGYWIVFSLLVITIACGVIVNQVPAGPIFAGIRGYLRAIPWFFVAAVFAFTSAHVKTQLRVLTVIGLIQLPFAIEQTLKQLSRGLGYSGDYTSGTLMLSPTLTIFLISAACIVAAMLVRRRLRWTQGVLLLLLLLFPTTINETKVTLIVLPVGFVAALVVAAQRGRRMKYAVVSMTVVALFAAGFVPIYNHLIKDTEYSTPIVEMMTDPAKLERYLWQKTDIGARGGVGRVDALVVPIRLVTADPVHAMFGYGIGNASDSALGSGFTGKYAVIFGPFTATSFGRVVIELGLLGFVLILALIWLILRDSLAVARQNREIQGALAAGWAAVTIIVMICVPYTELIAMTSVSYLFWYLSGLVAATRMRDLALQTAPAQVALRQPSTASRVARPHLRLEP